MCKNYWMIGLNKHKHILALRLKLNPNSYNTYLINLTYIIAEKNKNQ